MTKWYLGANIFLIVLIFITHERIFKIRATLFCSFWHIFLSKFSFSAHNLNLTFLVTSLVFYMNAFMGFMNRKKLTQENSISCWQKQQLKSTIQPFSEITFRNKFLEHFFWGHIYPIGKFTKLLKTKILPLHLKKIGSLEFQPQMLWKIIQRIEQESVYFK